MNTENFELLLKKAAFDLEYEFCEEIKEKHKNSEPSVSERHIKNMQKLFSEKKNRILKRVAAFAAAFVVCTSVALQVDADNIINNYVSYFFKTAKASVEVPEGFLYVYNFKDIPENYRLENAELGGNKSCYRIRYKSIDKRSFYISVSKKSEDFVLNGSSDEVFYIMGFETAIFENEGQFISCFEDENYYITLRSDFEKEEHIELCKSIYRIYPD